MKTPDINRILRDNPRNSAYGAPLGARNYWGDDGPVYLQRVRFVDGDYAPDGTYWGVSEKAGALWCAFSDETRIYVRAKNRAGAIIAIREDYPDITFHKGGKHGMP